MNVVFMVCDGEVGALRRLGAVVERRGLPGPEALAGVDADWVVFRLPGEGAASNDDALERLVELLPQLPEEACGAALRLRHRTPTGQRLLAATRAVRPQRFQGFTGVVEPSPACDGSVVTARMLTLDVDRAARPDVAGQAEHLEREGALREAASTWEQLEGLGDAWGAYVRLRAALCVAQVWPGAPRVIALLTEALACTGRAPEVALRLAGCWLIQGDVREAECFAEMADATRRYAGGIPQLEGVESWAVPALYARWLARIDPRGAATWAERALSRTPPPQLALELLELAGAAPVSRKNERLPRRTP